MCYQCHGSSEDTLKQLTEMYENKDFRFDQWNTTSVDHLFISMSNHDGPECKQLAIKIFKLFLEWYKENQKDNYFPELGMEQMYSQSCLSNILTKVEQSPDATEEELSTMFQKEVKHCRDTVKQVPYNQYQKKNYNNNIFKYSQNESFFSITNLSFFAVCFAGGFLIGEMFWKTQK